MSLQKKSWNKFEWPRFLLAIILLAIGLFNYWLFRPEIAFFRFFHVHHQPFLCKSNILQIFFSGYFSDICWCIALGVSIEACAKNNLLNTFAIVLILLIPLVLEISQYFKIISGTFDWIDLGLYATIIFVFSLRLFKIPRS
jgi:hypothetical protein